MLAECKESVQAQTLPATEHLIYLDRNISERVGLNLNRMAESTDCEWLAPLADDDLLFPQHLETLVAHSEDADVVYSKCQISGREGWEPHWPSEIPATTLIRRSLWEKLGGWSEAIRAEDRDFWIRARKKDARFVFVDEFTWHYRFGPWGNKSLVPEHHSFREAHAAASRVHS